jgi:hypothetical protein
MLSPLHRLRRLRDRLRGSRRPEGGEKPLHPRENLLRQMPKGGVAAEIGVHEGRFSARILEVTSPRLLHLIDPWIHETSEVYRDAWYGGQIDAQAKMDTRHQEVCRRFAAQIAAGRVEVHRMTSALAAQHIPDASLDWVYIDGNHLYEFVRDDLELFMPKVRSGGCIAGDDYGVDGWWSDGVERAVDEFAETHPELSLSVEGSQFILRPSD